jgi:hypothetical protein
LVAGVEPDLLGEGLVNRELLEGTNGRLEEVYDVLVLLAVGAAAGKVQGGPARRIPADSCVQNAALHSPGLTQYCSTATSSGHVNVAGQTRVRTVREQFQAAELDQERVHGHAVVRRDDGTVQQLRRRRRRAALAAEIAVRGVGAVAVVRPEVVNRPAILQRDQV